ncbi:MULTISPECIES: acetylornithine transaminase [Streptomyces]|uniref:Acetylornithine aminotransferase n=1 Tax=Streptomyces stelliscabiei TaxID=146820 RepID=A0A8I0P5Q4_9ACTN|nr:MULTISPECIES: acetylornithine transaminase [Streptomyces]KND43524.1 acetylornithine aminotransferase [Streptomyces stelliscabiei]MBE1595788.1 acetylornithine aminotransferase [Streptomyces stelliscabiei]MDX2517803.1 acetylornithine transaminase [Streptomyces stelliscabiei]MDX2555615.1 acetylornithine transaminase [Streptomyces stelliscabiei]MDX2614134.1 acetylornithine transaminase [Streptomyces stelliscabiei]
MTANEELSRRWRGSLMNNYGTPQLSLVRGAGTKVWDADGKEYLDYVGGIAVNALGHAHPAVVEAVGTQIASLGHVSNLFIAEPPVALAERLLEHFGRDGKVFFCNSGAEANEGAFKIGRLTGRTHMVATEGGFHGRTMGALALTGQPGKQTGFHPLPGDVTHVPYGDAQALAAAVTEETALVIIEPVQGEKGVVVPPPGYLKAARAITAAKGALLVLDEVQTGIGRTGHWFEYQAHEGVLPDVVTLAKGLGGGLPIGATVAFGRAADLFRPGGHGTTFGGNPVACAAGLAVLETIQAENLLENVKRQSEKLRDGIESLGDPMIDHVRGAGLLLGIVLTEPLAPLAQQAAQDAGFLVNAPAPDVVRLMPPLNVADAEVDALLRALPGILDAARAAHEASGDGRAGE